MDRNTAKTILLVEDEVIIAMLEKQQLEKICYIIHHVTTGEKAVEIIINNELPIDLILMDIDLGSGIDGTQAAEKILKLKNVPIIFLSSHTEPEIVEKTEKITSYGYVVKNSNITVLDASIKMAFKLFIANLKIHESDNLNESTMNAIPDMIGVLDNDYNVIKYNDAVYKLINKSNSECAGNKCYKLVGKDNSCEICAVKRTYASRRIEQVERYDDILEIWIELRAYPILDANGNVIKVVEHFRDITERKRAEEIQKLNYSLLQIAGESAHFGGWSVDLINNICTWSDAVADIHEVSHGYASTVEEGINFYAPEWQKKIKQVFNSCVKNGIPYDENMEIITKKGKRVWVRTIGKAVKNNDGTIIKVQGSFQDITNIKQVENEIQRQLSEKETLLREVHHRIKNNIANVEGLLTLQVNSTNSLEVKTALQGAITRIQSIRILYEKLLLTKDYQEISFKSYVESLLDSIFAVYDIDNITIKKQITDFTIDSKKSVSLGIIINELLNNVFKYAFAGLNKASVTISIDKTENTVILIIQDNGIGIDERISSNKSPGLGHIIVKMLVEQLKGTYNIVIENGTKNIIQFDI